MDQRCNLRESAEDLRRKFTCSDGNLGLLLEFFFRAEGGIRYLYVTGVQTCALPIYWMPMPSGMPSVDPCRTHATTPSILSVPQPGTSKASESGSPTSSGSFVSRKMPPLDRFTERSEERRVGKECRTRGAEWYRDRS